MMKFNLLPEDVILHIFSFISFKVLLGTISRVCKLWHKICDDPTIVRKASAKEFYSVRLSENLTHQQLQNVVERVIWVRSADVKSFDLAKTAISWEYIDSKKRKNNWKNLRILNIAKLVSAEFQVTKAFANLLELNVCESKFNDNHLVEVSKMCNRLRILNVSGCDITDFGIENTSLQSLIFINISNCKMLTERSISRIIENWETISLCVKGLNLSVAHFQELYGDDMEAEIIFLCGLWTKQERKCRYCRETLFLTWTDVTGIDSLSTLIM